MSGRRSGASVLILSLLMLGAAGWCLLSRALAPGDGATVNLGDAAFSPAGVVVISAAPGSALRPGDIVDAIDGRPLPRLGGPPAEAGDTLVYDIRRDGVRLSIPVHLRPYPVTRDVGHGWPTLLVIGLLAVTSITIFRVRPTEPAARAALLASGFAVLTTTGAAVFGLQPLDLAVGDQFWRWYVGEAAFVLLWGAMLHFALVFTGPRPRWQTAGAYLGGPLLYGIAAVVSGGFTAAASPALPALFAYPAVLLAVLAHTYATVPEARRRLRWLAVALGGGVLVYLAVWALPTALSGAPLLPERYHTLVFLPVPIAVAAAILRHRALDIEVAISRSLVYGALSAGMLGAYIAVVTALSLLFPPMDRLWQQAVAAAAVALLVQPLHNWMRERVNRRLFGHPDDPYHVVSTLADRLAGTRAPGETLPDIVATVSRALRLPYLAVEFQGRTGPEVAASTGEPPADTHRLPLMFAGERIGTLVAGGPGVLRRRERVALAEVARHLGAAVHTAQLTRDLRRSRDRLVRAREEERRRLLHELHDGVGPTLAAIALGLDASRRGVVPDSPTAALLARLRTELADAIGEIRRLAHGLRPPVLDQIGLVPALRAYAGALASRTAQRDASGAGVTIMLEVPTVMPRLPASVDVAVYRIVCEALTNVTRHANARSCAVRLWVDDELHIEVVDDGIGLPERATAGVGLASMRERAAELGGDCLVHSDGEGGTRVLATLPLPKEGVHL
ncbi:ATP-binding protein [Actinokineospora sp. 24-640]